MRELYKHVKTGVVYEVICNATIEADGTLAVVYKNGRTGERWIRPASEFNDGRFERAPDNALDCPHAAPFRFCPECVVSPCPIGMDKKMANAKMSRAHD